MYPVTKIIFMKVIKFITHPYIIIISFFGILISGEHLAGFYLLYLLLALPHGSSHSLLALFGVILMLISYYKFKQNKTYVVASIINTTGIMLLILSLFLFFYNDKEHYNIATFYETVPQITLFIFVSLSTVFLLDSLIYLFKNFGISKVERQV